MENTLSGKWSPAQKTSRQQLHTKEPGNRLMKKRRIPPMLADVIQATLLSCEGVLFDTGESCPACGGQLSGYDVKKKQFAVMREGEEKKTVYVLVKRFRCRTCREISFADQPFYPETRIGSPIIDLCVTLGETMHFPRVSSTLEEMGIIVDRWSVRNYIRKNSHAVPGADMFGIRVPLSIISLSNLAMGSPEGSHIGAPGLLAACGYPSRKKDPTGLPSQHRNTDP